MMHDVGVSQGTVVDGKYRLERLLGRGGMGTVWAARHLTLGELYAIKFVTPGPGDRDEAHARFRREAKAAAQLASDHVAKVMDVGVHGDDELYIVMEHLDGMDLDAFARKRGAMSPGEAAACVVQACSALAEAHDKSIIHRDIKLANLFVTTSHGAPMLKVLDFGVSKTVGADMTSTSAVLGSPKYMSPEQMDDPRAVDGRTDVWSLGVVLYRLVAGRLPFDGETLGRICMAVMRESPPPLASVRAGLPPGFVAIVDRCLEKDRARRFASVGELATALAPFVTHVPPPDPSVASIEAPEAATVVAATVLSPPKIDASQNRSWSKTGDQEVVPAAGATAGFPSGVGIVAGVGAIVVMVSVLGAAVAYRARVQRAAAEAEDPPAAVEAAAPVAAGPTGAPSVAATPSTPIISTGIPLGVTAPPAASSEPAPSVAVAQPPSGRRWPAPPARSATTAPPKGTTKPGAPLIPEDRR